MPLRTLMSSTLSSVLEVCLVFVFRQDCLFLRFLQVFHSVYVFIPVFSSLSYPPSYVFYLALLSNAILSPNWSGKLINGSWRTHFKIWNFWSCLGHFPILEKRGKYEVRKNVTGHSTMKWFFWWSWDTKVKHKILQKNNRALRRIIRVIFRLRLEDNGPTVFFTAGICKWGAAGSWISFVGFCFGNCF